MKDKIEAELAHVQRLISANRRRKRAEKTLRRVRRESMASIEHWKQAAAHWQEIAHCYAVRCSWMPSAPGPDGIGAGKRTDCSPSVQARLKLLFEKCKHGESVFLSRCNTEVECKIASIGVASSTHANGMPTCSVDLVDVSEDRLHYAIDSLDEIIIKD